MDYSVKSTKLDTLASRCLVVAVYTGDKKGVLGDNAAGLDRQCDGRLSRLVSQGDISGKPGTHLMVYDLAGLRAQRVLLVGLGQPGQVGATELRKAAQAAAGAAKAARVAALDIALFESQAGELGTTRSVRHVLESVDAACYQYRATFGKPPDSDFSLKRVAMVVERANLKAAKEGVRQGTAVAHGVALARELGNRPGNRCTPTYLAEQAMQMQSSLPIQTQVLNEEEMEALNMGALLSVSRGSREPAKLIIMEYRGGDKNDPPIVLVGKGLTFDAGGISLKPAASMDEMKFDMCGGASVFGALRAAAEMALPLNVIGVVPSSENLPDGAANKPGDVVTSMAGKTIEILNTDAEGRLILCDALTYIARYQPAAVVDIATLTGACIIALGSHASGLFSNHDGLADELLAAGEASGDRAWRLPVWEDYTRQLKSSFADLANIGGKGAGAVTAACFLQEFAEDYHWAHLDIAGTAWKTGGEKGATGRPVPLLVEFLLNRAG